MSSFDDLRNLGLPAGDYAVFGSGPLYVRGVIDEVGDLDVLARDAAWSKALELGTLVHLDDLDVDVVEVEGTGITIGTTWAIGEFDVNELIDNAELIEGLPFVQLRHVVRYKRIANRPKDQAHLRRLNTSEWSHELER